MKYKEKLLELIFEEDDAFANWVATFPVLEQIDIYKEYTQVIQQLLDDVGDDSQAEFMQEFNKEIDELQERYLDVQVDQLKNDMAVDQIDKNFEEMEDRVRRIRLYLKECIETNAPNAEEMKQLAKDMIALEKKDNLYDPANWSWFNQED
ncbi:hypothetical protein BH09BAC2_BH09BAC2_09910 [soil metagenome]